MIGFLRGKIVKKQPPGLLLDVNGVGYELEASMNTFYQLPDAGADIELLTHLWVREDSHTLYGFGNEAERSLFRALVKVNGVGAKMALAMLSGIDAAEFGQCIETGDAARLQRLPGVGKKTAQRLIVELRDRSDSWDTGGQPDKAVPGARSRGADPISEAVSAMISLGYRPQEASRLVHAVGAADMDSEALIRAALKAAMT